MEFDWLDAAFDLHSVTPREIEETFEDPFSLRILPDIPSNPEARYFSIGKTINGRCLFNVFWTDGKKYRVILSRNATAEEAAFYERINMESAY